MSINNNNVEVNFFGVGAPKCGTSWLFNCLSEHPDIDFARHKETNFFLPDDSPVIKAFSDLVYGRVKPRTWEDFKKEFTNITGKVRGEFSVYYMYDEKALKAIKKFYPQAKIIISLRNPIDHFSSSYWFYKNSNLYDLVPDTIEECMNRKSVIDLFGLSFSDYYPSVKKCYDLFGADHIHVVLYDDIASSAQDILVSLYNFLDVTPNYIPRSLDRRSNPTMRIKSPYIARFTHIIARVAKRWRYTTKLYDILNKNERLFKFYNLLFKSDFKYPKLSGKTRRNLLSKLKPNILLLEKLIERDLSIWYAEKAK